MCDIVLTANRATRPKEASEFITNRPRVRMVDVTSVIIGLHSGVHNECQEMLGFRTQWYQKFPQDRR